MAASMRSEVIRCFRQLHRTRRKVFANDEAALAASRNKINDEFAKNKNVKNPATVEELVKFGYQVEEVLRTTVIQAQQKEGHVFQIKITEDTAKLENVPFHDPDSSSGTCCQQKQT